MAIFHSKLLTSMLSYQRVSIQSTNFPPHFTCQAHEQLHMVCPEKQTRLVSGAHHFGKWLTFGSASGNSKKMHMFSRISKSLNNISTIQTFSTSFSLRRYFCGWGSFENPKKGGSPRNHRMRIKNGRFKKQNLHVQTHMSIFPARFHTQKLVSAKTILQCMCWHVFKAYDFTKSEDFPGHFFAPNRAHGSGWS